MYQNVSECVFMRNMTLIKLDIEGWVLRIVQAMYTNARRHVRVNGTLREKVVVKIGVHQGSVISPFIVHYDT